MSLPVRLFEYARSCNIGDDIQTLAVAQHIEGSGLYIDRDELSSYLGDPCAVVMNGWFTKNPAALPPSEAIHPVWIGFHLGPHVRHILDRTVVRTVLRQNGPIGCRDPQTAEMLAAAGIAAFVSGCLTTTFPRRTSLPADPRTYLVDTAGVPLPEHLRGPDSIRITHMGAGWWSHAAKRSLAADLLGEYRDHAGIVVTTRLHCALPCVAMGIPVVFVGDMTDRRLQPIEGLAEVIHFPHELRSDGPATRVRRRHHWLREMRDRDWTGFAADIEDQKTRRVALLSEGLERVGAAGARPQRSGWLAA